METSTTSVLYTIYQPSYNEFPVPFLTIRQPLLPIVQELINSFSTEYINQERAYDHSQTGYIINQQGTSTTNSVHQQGTSNSFSTNLSNYGSELTNKSFKQLTNQSLDWLHQTVSHATNPSTATPVYQRLTEWHWGAKLGRHGPVTWTLPRVREPQIMALWSHRMVKNTVRMV